MTAVCQAGRQAGSEVISACERPRALQSKQRLWQLPTHHLQSKCVHRCAVVQGGRVDVHTPLFWGVDSNPPPSHNPPTHKPTSPLNPG